MTVGRAFSRSFGRRAACLMALALPVPGRAQGRTTMLQDLARRAAIYLFPLYEMYRTRWNATTNDRNPLRQRLNHFTHVPVLATARSRMVTTPNTDTLYSSAWLDLSGDPLFLTVPPMGERYYSFAFMDLFTNNFDYVCRRLHGGAPGPRMIVGPRWKGDTPKDVTLVRSPTTSVWLLGRILVDGEGDLAQARALQGRTLLETPDMRNERRILAVGELMRTRAVAPPEPVAEWLPLNRDDPFDLFEVGMRALGESPLSDRDRDVLEELAPLRLHAGSKFDLRAFGDAERQAIVAGIDQARAEIRGAGGHFGKVVNGWSYPDRTLGNFGDNYLYRAQVALGGLAALEPVEATYLACSTDQNGRPLDGRQRYVLRFEPDQLPPSRAFWSLSMYEVTTEGRAFFTDNPLNRYAIGDRTKGLSKGSDGSLEIYLQHERPAENRIANWLPAPAGPLRLVLRAYEPDETLLDGRYRAPAVRGNSPP
jgi:hypothetical protein